MAKTTEILKNSILVVNTAFLSAKGNVQAYACRERGVADAKTIKISPVTLKGRELFAGDVLYVTDATLETETGSNYRTLRQGHVQFELATSSAPAAESAVTSATDAPFPTE